jgi:hypothetical protein
MTSVLCSIYVVFFVSSSWSQVTLQALEPHTVLCKGRKEREGLPQAVLSPMFFSHLRTCLMS